MAQTDAPLLDLQTLITRPVVRIRNGDEAHDYELRTPDEMSVLDFVRLRPLAAEADRFIKAILGNGIEQLSEADAKAGEESLIAFCELILLAPREVIESLSIPQRAQILMAFTRLGVAKVATPPSEPAATETKTETTPTGESSSPS